MFIAIRERLERGRKEGGFTLIELMVVVLIIAILIAIAIPTFLGARQRAQNRAAQSNVRNALVAADVHFTDGDTYVGFTAAQGDTIEPSLNWVETVAPTTGQVSIRIVATATEVLLTTRSASGTYYCLVKNSTTGQTFGNAAADIATVLACTGGW